MVWCKIDSSLGRLWVNFLKVLHWVLDKLPGSSSKNRPSPLKSFSASLNKGN